MAKHIFVTGGVVSSLGKGLTSASIGMLLEQRGLHGAAAEARSVHQRRSGHDEPLPARRSLRARRRQRDRPRPGPLRAVHAQPADARLELHDRPDLPVGHQQGAARRVSGQDRAGDPAHHQRDQSVHPQAGRADDVDVVITEIGGTVGDIESLPFLEAIRQFALDVGKENCLYIHLTLVPYLKAAGELKTKPTQHSVGQLRQIGIQPDVLICRTERRSAREDREKIALFCNVPIDAVIEEKDKDFSIYEVPLSLVDNRLDELIVDKLGLQGRPSRISTIGANCCTACAIPSTRSASPSSANTPSTTTPTSRSTKRSTTPASHHGARSASAAFKARRSNAKAPSGCSRGYDGILVPGGFGERGIEGKIEAIRYARERGIPFFGICLGMQCAVIEFARNVVRPGRRPLDRVRQGHAAPGDLPARRAERRSPTRAARCGWARSRRSSAAGSIAARVLRQDEDLRAAPAPLRVQQRLPPAVRGPRHAILRHQPRQRWSK